MSELKIASRYAKALFLKAQEGGVLDDVMKDMQELIDLSNDLIDLHCRLSCSLLIDKLDLRLRFGTSNHLDTSTDL